MTIEEIEGSFQAQPAQIRRLIMRLSPTHWHYGHAGAQAIGEQMARCGRSELHLTIGCQ